MRISTTNELQEILCALTLSPSDQSAVESKRSIGSENSSESSVEWPRVTVGRPQTWDLKPLLLRTALSNDGIDALSLEKHDYFLVRFACSFWLPESATITWARLMVSLTSDQWGGPIAVDLHPDEVYEKTATDVNIRISPTLKFERAEGSIGEAAVQLHYMRLEPVITSAGLLEPVFGWDLRSSKMNLIRGSRWFHAVLQKPLTSGPIEATLQLSAEVKERGKLFHFSTSSLEDASLRCNLTP